MASDATGTDTPYRFVRRMWKGEPIGGWSVVRADNGRYLGWLRRPAAIYSSWVRWEVRVHEEAFRGDGPDNTGELLDKVPDWLLRGHYCDDTTVVGGGRTRDEAAFELLLWLDDKHAPAVGYGQHPEVCRWADR
jgi:hypothetical protein